MIGKPTIWKAVALINIIFPLVLFLFALRLHFSANTRGFDFLLVDYLLIASIVIGGPILLSGIALLFIKRKVVKTLVVVFFFVQVTLLLLETSTAINDKCFGFLSQFHSLKLNETTCAPFGFTKTNYYPPNTTFGLYEFKGSNLIIPFDVSSNVPVRLVELYIDGKQQKVFSSSPSTYATYTYEWNTTNVSKGNHFIKVLVNDSSGNSSIATTNIEIN